MSVSSAAGILAGLWLMAAPSLLHYEQSSLGDIHRIAGPISASLALIAAWGVLRAVRWPNVLIGVAVASSASASGNIPEVVASTLASGLVLLLATPFARKPKRRLGGGWRVLFRGTDPQVDNEHTRRSKMHERDVVVVTGASAGVGRAIVRAFAETGADIGLLARNRGGLEAAAKEVEQAGGRAVVVPVDVADPDAVEAAAEQIERELGPISVWVNDAMASVFAEFLDVTPSEFRRVTDVTYHGYVNGTRAALRRMLPRDRGVIIQVGSALAYRGIPLQSAYCGAKHAVEGFSESIRCELIHRKSHVRLGMIQLPAVNTPQFDWVLSRLPNKAKPVPPIYQPEPIAESVVAFAKRPRREMWLAWATIRAIVANRLVPGILDRYLGATGFGAQQTDEPMDPDRPSNLWEPLEGDWGAHGRFDKEAYPDSRMMWMSRHRRALSVAGTTAVALAAAVMLGRR